VPTWSIWLIVIAAAVILAGLIVSVTGRRRVRHRRTRAEELLRDATAHASGLPESRRRAEELRAEADLARAEAARAEHRAATAERAHRVEVAGYEDRLREAERIDPGGSAPS